MFGCYKTCEVLAHVFVYHITLGERMIEEDILQYGPVFVPSPLLIAF